MILDIYTLYSYDTLRVLASEIRGMDTPPYGEMRIKEKKENEKGRERERERERRHAENRAVYIY